MNALPLRARVYLVFLWCTALLLHIYFLADAPVREHLLLLALAIPLYALADYFEFTFEELDLYFRTYDDLDGWAWHQNSWLYDIWFQHFEYYTHDKSCTVLGILRNMKVTDWIAEMRSLLYLQVCSEQTWT